MTKNSRAVYLGNTENEDCGFTPGMKYEIHDFEDGYIGVYDNNDVYRYIKNGAFHSFMLHCEDGYFVTETECASMPPSADKKPEFRYYINGEVVTKVKFDDTLLCVKDFKSDGVDVSSIKFEVKFQ